MSQSFNLNIDDYSIKELERLLSLPFPYTQNDVEIRGDKVKAQLFAAPNLKEEDRDKVIFFIGKTITLLKGRLTRTVLEPQLKQNRIVESDGHMVIVPPKDRLNKPDDKWGGTVNPFSTTIWGNTDKMINKMVNIDSLFRKNYFNTKSSNFRFTLPEPIKNVVSMSLGALELPLSIYNISSELNNNYFRIAWQVKSSSSMWKNRSTYIIIPDGNYSGGMVESGDSSCVDNGAINPASMAWELNLQLARPYTGTADGDEPIAGGTGGLIQATVDQRTGKIIMGLASTSNVFTDISNVDFQLYFSDPPPHKIKKVGEATDMQIPLQQKLGWILGYRFGKYVGSPAYVSEGRYDFRGPKYLYLMVDDHNNNHIANHITGTFTDSLTPGRENILARLSWKQYSYYSTNNDPFDCSTLASVTRNYLGPVDIQHLHIKIVDQYGRIVSLNNMDFALALNFKILYG